MVMRGIRDPITFALAAVLFSLLMSGCGATTHRPPVAEPPEVSTQPSTQQPSSEVVAQAPQRQPEAPPTSVRGAPAPAPSVAVGSAAPPQPATAATPTPQP